MSNSSVSFLSHQTCYVPGLSAAHTLSKSYDLCWLTTKHELCKTTSPHGNMVKGIPYSACLWSTDIDWN